MLLDDAVSQVVERHKTDLEKETLNNLDSVPEFTTHPETVIESVIQKRLRGIGDVVLS